MKDWIILIKRMNMNERREMRWRIKARLARIQVIQFLRSIPFPIRLALLQALSILFIILGSPKQSELPRIFLPVAFMSSLAIAITINSVADLIFTFAFSRMFARKQ